MKFDPTDRITVKEGWLTKQGGIIKSWKQRWFVLYDNNELCYFKSAYDRVPIDIISLANMTQLPSRVNTQIELAVEGRVYQFQAPTMDEAEEWLSHFNERAPDKAKRMSTTISASSNPSAPPSSNLSASSSSLPSLNSSSSSLFSSPTKQQKQQQQQQQQYQKQADNIDSPSSGPKDQTVIDIKGMMCQHCEDIVYRLMNGTKGVEECNVSVDDDLLMLKGNPNVDDVLRSLESHGFIVSIATQ